jgi:transcriptional regulator with XRE-family HTH domain
VIGWGARIRETVKGLRGFKYDDAASVLGRHKSTIFDYEKEVRAPDIAMLIRLQELSGVSIDWLATGKGPRVRGLDKSALHTAVTAAVKIVESARAQGKQHQPEDVVAFIVDIYESVIKDSLDGNIPRTDSEQISPSKEATADARDRKTNS